MTIKTYRGHSVADALSQVKNDLGPDAVILHTRTLKSRGRLGSLNKVTEITATTQAVLTRRRDQLAAAVAAPREPVATAPEPSRVARARISRQDDEIPAEPMRRTRETPVREMPRVTQEAVAEEPVAQTLRPTVIPAPAPLREPLADAVPAPTAAVRASGATSMLSGPDGSCAERSTPAFSPPAVLKDVARTIAGPADRGADDLRGEIAQLRQMVGQVLHATRSGGNARMPEALFDCYLSMLNAEVASELADSIVGAVRDEMTPAELTRPELVRRVVLRQLAAYIQVASEPPPMQRTTDGRPFTLALVGPTGVGKTTTLAKLAATYKLRYGRRIGLVTSDTYRIAAVEQLRTYANIIGLPLQVALTPEEMAAACERCSDCDAVLIDTAGRSPRDAMRLEELRGFLEVARPHQTHLVLSSSMSEAVMKDAASRFAPLRPDHLIFTKLDEAVNFGVLINIARAVDARLSFVTTGQEVPDHIEHGNPERLARLILEGEAVR
ncbi:MAG: flagellar biosynthesis protein FlhF [Phycisphaerales bacterium]|nr:flagellar biosynthesis protein FlhF [Phycisphaerales bacterium]